MEVKNPRRILFLGHPDSGVLALLKDLTGASPEPRLIPDPSDSSESSEQASIATTAGLNHHLNISNSYYKATIPIWLDELTSTSAWKADFLSPEASEVVQAIGAWVIVFRLGNTPANAERTIQDGSKEVPSAMEFLKDAMAAVKEVISEAFDGDSDAWDGVCLAVGMPSVWVGGGKDTESSAEGERDQWDDLCWDYGFEFIDGTLKDNSTRKAESRDSNGIARMKEALEANDWTADEAEDALGLLEDESGDAEDEFGPWEEGFAEEDPGFRMEKAEMEREFAGLKMSIQNPATATEEHEAAQVEELDRMMGRMLAVRDMSAHMPERERKRLAARTVSDIMKSM